jgi:hypothetical protein
MDSKRHANALGKAACLLVVAGCSQVAGLDGYDFNRPRPDEDAGLSPEGSAGWWGGGSGGTAGTAGTAGKAGSAGTGGTAGTGGSAGKAGSAGSAGSAGKAGSGGADGGCVSPAPGGGTCDTFPQCGCQAGWACDFYLQSTWKTQCFQSGNVQRGRSCSKTGECAPEMSCVDNACKSYCGGKASDCTTGPSAACIQVVYNPGDGGVANISGFFVCTDQCDLTNPSATCGPGVTCMPYSPVAQNPGQSGCSAPAGTSTTTCPTGDECAPGYLCMNDQICHRFCKTSSGCASPQTCKTLNDGKNTGWFYVGTQQYGTCQ